MANLAMTRNNIIKAEMRLSSRLMRKNKTLPLLRCGNDYAQYLGARIK